MYQRVRTSRRVTRVVGVLGLASLLGASCGGGDRLGGSASRARASDTQADASSPTGEEAEGRSKKSGGDSKRATTTTSAQTGAGPSAAKPGGGNAPTAPAEPKMQISLTLATACVRPGNSQTITISAPENTAAGYNTYYSDGKSAMHEGFYGGNYVGSTDESGTWTHTWVVAATAPAGETVVVVLASHPDHGRGEAGTTFHVADALGTCS